MFFRPAKTLFGTYLQNARKENFKPSAFTFLDTWKPYVDRKTMKIGFNNLDPRVPSIPANFDNFTVTDPISIITCTDGLHGVITPQGEIVKPEFASIINYGNVAIVNHGSLKKPQDCGLLDMRTGEYIIPPKYDKLEAHVCKATDRIISFSAYKTVDGETKQQLFSTTGKVIIPLNATELREHYFAGGTAYSYRNPTNPAQKILVDQKGTQILSTVGDFEVHPELIIANSVGGAFVYGTTDKGAIKALMHSPYPLTYLDDIVLLDEKLFKQTYPTGVIGKDGQEIFACQIINHEGKVLSDSYEDIKVFDGDYFKTKQDGLWGLISREDYQPALPHEFDEILPQFGRPTFAQKDGLWGVLGKGPEFKTVVPYAYDAQSISKRRQILDGRDINGKEVSIEIGRNSVYVSTYAYENETDPVSTETFHDTYREQK